MRKAVAFIGSAGVPNRYGGFESFLDACAPIMAEDRPVIVTCDAARYQDQAPCWSGVERRFIRIGANGATSVLHDLVAFFNVYRDVGAIVILGVSAGIFMPLFRILCAIHGIKLVVNVDGIEWRREKFSAGKKAFLWVSDRLAQICAHRVVVDSRALAPFLSSAGRDRAVYIAYSGDQVERAIKRKNNNYCLTICRIEPENNCELLIEGFLRSGEPEYRFVGNWNGSEYGRALRERYKNESSLQMIDAVYDPQLIADLRENSTIYLHGHSVGGTNPSLVEMLYYDARIIAFDCAFNVETAGEAARYFRDQDSLVAALQERSTAHDSAIAEARMTARARYTRRVIATQYAEAIDG